MATKTNENPTKNYARFGIIAAIVIAVAAGGTWLVSSLNSNSGASVEESMEVVTTDAANAANLRIAVIRMDAIQTDAAALKDLRA